VWCRICRFTADKQIPASRVLGAGILLSIAQCGHSAFSYHVSGMRMVIVLCATTLACKKLGKAQRLVSLNALYRSIRSVAQKLDHDHNSSVRCRTTAGRCRLIFHHYCSLRKHHHHTFLAWPRRQFPACWHSEGNCRYRSEMCL